MDNDELISTYDVSRLPKTREDRMDNDKLISTYDVSTLPKTREELCEFYEDWAKTYETDFNYYGYEGPRVTAETLQEYVESKSAMVLDLCSGTGLVGVQLRMRGFSNIHGIDMSARSLKICEEKQIYKSFICAEIGVSPLKIQSDTYDALVSSGAFLPTHLNQSVFPELIRVVKPGGFIINTMREEVLWTADEYNEDKLENAIQDLIEDKKWKLVLKKKFPGYYHDKDGVTFILQVL